MSTSKRPETDLALNNLVVEDHLVAGNLTVRGRLVANITEESPLPIIRGGTGSSDFNNNGTLFFDGLVNRIESTQPGTAGQVLTSNGSLNPPSFQNIVIPTSGVSTTNPPTQDRGVPLWDGPTGNFIRQQVPSTDLARFNGSVTSRGANSISNTSVYFGAKYDDGSSKAGGTSESKANGANTGIGVGALSSVTIGQGNTALGFEALNANTKGGTHTAIGFQALPLSQESDGNTAVGATTLPLCTTGSNNTAIGGSAGGGLTTGGSNVFLGANTSVTVGTSVGSILIGEGAQATTSGQLVIHRSSSVLDTKSINGTVQLAAGTAIVAVTSVTAATIILLTIQSPGGTPGSPYISARVPGASFTITSTSGTDTSMVGYLMVEP